MNFDKQTSALSKGISSTIRVRRLQQNPQKTVPAQIDFQLTSKNLDILKQQRDLNLQLVLSPALQSELRHCAITKSSQALVFTTYYSSPLSQPLAVIKTEVSLQGKLKQQFRRSYLEKPELLKELSLNHYWLMGRVCDALAIDYNPQHQVLAIAIASALLVLFIPVVFWLLPWGWLLKLLVLALIWGFGYLVCQNLIHKYAAKFIWQQLLFGQLSASLRRRNLGWQLWRYFG